MSGKVKNTLGGRQKSAGAAAVFNPRTIMLMIIIGVFSFSAYFVLAGFSDRFKSGDNGASHVLSKSAIGFSGLLHLLKQNSQDVDISRAAELSGTESYGLRILSPALGFVTDDLEDVNISSSTLIIMPKWVTQKHPKHKGWVRKRNTPYSDAFGKNSLSSLLGPVIEDVSIQRSAAETEKVTILPSIELGNEKDIHFYNFSKLQTISGDGLRPIIVTSAGTLLAKVIDEDIYILADPDFLNTHGLAQPDMPEFALSLLTMLERDSGSSGFLFDLSLHGFSRSQNFIKLALTPPFLAATLCLLAMLILIAWQAFMRFGAPVKSGREIALGKLSLIYNAANFIKLAGREYKMAPDYMRLTRKLVADRMHIPSGLSEAEIIKRLDVYSRHAGSNISWAELEAETKTPRNATGLMQSARKLYQWRGEITHEHN